jgi:hypothetical protein
MDKLVAFAESVRTWLETNIGLGAAFAVLCVLVFLFVYAFRKLAPNAWIWLVKRVPYIDFDETPVRAFLDKTLQALPGTVFAAVLGALSTGGNVKAAALAALAGPLMAVAHHILEAIPWIPYLGRLGSRAKQRFTPPPASAILLFIGAGACFMISGVTACNLFGSNGPLYPSVVKCLPPTQEAEDVVKDILLSGLDGYKQALDNAALKYGPSTVLCIVNSLVSEWGGPGSPARESKRAQAAKLRGSEFLAEHPAKVEQ